MRQDIIYIELLKPQNFIELKHNLEKNINLKNLKIDISQLKKTRNGGIELKRSDKIEEHQIKDEVVQKRTTNTYKTSIETPSGGGGER